MGIASLQVCMDSADWLQGGIQEDSGIDSSSPSGDMLTCSRPLIIERRLRPQHDQALKCPRCDSTHTKFCYYNNYSLSQPRYFCKACRRYWTKGGILRNIPVGGGCRKNKKIIPKKSNDHNHNHNPATDLHLSSSSFPEVQFSHLTNFSDFMVENPIRPVDFMERKIEDIVRNSKNYVEFGDMGNINMGLGSNFHGFCSPFGISLDHGNSAGTLMDTCQRLMVPYEGNEDQNGLDLKPNTKVLSLDWQGQGCSDAGKDYSFGHTDGLGSWTGLMNGYGASAATNPLV